MGTKSPGAVQKTRFMLSSALMRLLEKNSFKNISIGDICAEAMVSRSAFYLHFADKYELLSFLMDGVMRLHEEKYDRLSMEARLTAMLDDVKDKKRIMYNTFMADPSHEMLDIFSNSLNGFVRKHFEKQKAGGMSVPKPEEVAVSFYAGGLAGIIACWIRSGFSIPKEEIASCMSSLLTAPVFGAQTEQASAAENGRQYKSGTGGPV